MIDTIINFIGITKPIRGDLNTIQDIDVICSETIVWITQSYTIEQISDQFGSKQY